MSNQENKDFIENSLQLFDYYNKHHLFYRGGTAYDKLVTADPFVISEKEYKAIINAGIQIPKWLDEQSKFFSLINKKDYAWLNNLLVSDISSESFSLQKKVNELKGVDTNIFRVDLSSLPFNSHEAQLRWAGLGHIHFIDQAHKSICGDSILARSENKNFTNEVQNLVDYYCQQDDEYCLYLVPDKYRDEFSYIASNMRNIIYCAPEEFNESSFKIKNNSLIRKSDDKKVKLVVRRQITLPMLSKTTFGTNVINMYLDGNIEFEPGLNLLSDMKIGMALAFDERTKNHFSDDSRKLFLKTAFFDSELTSFRNVFNRKYMSTAELIENTSKAKRKLIFKYGGSDLVMSFGSSEVYRLDVQVRQVEETLKKGKKGIWIIQEFDPSRYSFRYITGDYKNRKNISIVENKHFSARLQTYFSSLNQDQKPINMTANLVNDHWKARFKISDQDTGKGALVTPIHVAFEPTE